jgi:hypothetical protein
VSGHHQQALAFARLQRSLRAGKETPGGPHEDTKCAWNRVAAEVTS